MLKNYFTIAINNLLKNKLYSVINIIGLAIGLAAFLLIALYVQNELSYDRHWEKADLIYRINNVRNEDSGQDISESTSGLLLPALKKYFPEDIEFGTRIMRNDGEIQIGDKRHEADFAGVDEDFIRMFQVNVLRGSLNDLLHSPNNIALSEKCAILYYGDRDPIGEVITLRDIPYKVTVVYRFISPKTVLNIPGFSLLDDSKLPDFMRSWDASSPETYVRFKETTDIKKIITRLPNFIDKIIPVNRPLESGQKLSDVLSLLPQKIRDIYFHPYDPDTRQTRIGNRTVIAVYITISLLVLIIGCINFVILTTAKATQRAREVAMRKVVGARFKQLFIQFLGESLLITFLAFLISIAITELVLPFFETLMDLELTVPYTSPENYLFALLLISLVGISGGLYPAFILSRFSPARALKANQTTEANGSFKLRNVLVVFQFTASIGLIIATSVAFFQLQYASKHDPGFNPDNLLVVEKIYKQDITNHRKTLQQELLKLPEVINAGLSSKQPSSDEGLTVGGRLRPKTSSLKQGQEKSINGMFVDYDFFNTYEISLLSGRFFSRNLDQEEPAFNFFGPPNTNNEEIKDKRLIINLAAAEQLGYASPDEAVGKILVSGNPDTPYYREYTIIGVVENSQFRDLRLKSGAEIYQLSPGSTYFLTVKYKGKYKAALKEVKKVWHEVVGDIPFNSGNVKQNMAAIFVQEKRENKVLISFSLLAIFIACMGLFGMAAFTVERRVKEIGLRKVMGAKVKDIVNFLGWNFLKPVLISNVIAWPVAIFAMQNWLERFPYRFHSMFMIPICLGSGFIALVIAWFTVAGNTKRVAKSRPIKALRYE